MANARLLRQRVEDAQKEQVALNAQYEKDYEAYVGEVDKFNAGVTSSLWNPETHVYLRDAKAQNESYARSIGPSSYDPSKLEFAPSSSVSDKVIENSPLMEQLVRNPTTGKVEIYTASVVPDADGAPTQNKTWALSGEANILNSNIKVPVPQAARTPNLTVSDIRELADPGQNQASLSMLAAKGIIGKSQLAGDYYSKNSAFNDPKDQNNLKQHGVLARTLGGQL